jgi:hypothetical protein
VGVASSHDTVAVRRGGLPQKNIQLHQKPGGPEDLLDRTEATATDKRGERIEVMTITEWIIRLSIFGVLALAVLGTVQNLVDAMKKKS